MRNFNLHITSGVNREISSGFLITGLISLLIMLLPASVFAQANRNKGGDNKDFKPQPGNAWTLTDLLGAHEESSIDTLLYNYQRFSIPAMRSDAWATTGNLGAEGINMLYFDRTPTSGFFFKDALSTWIPSFDTYKFYNVYIPMTLVSYNFAGNKQNHQDRLQATFAGNVNRRIGFGANLDYLYSKGCYEAQATKDLTFGLSGYYNGDRYEMQAFFYHYNFLNKENGGITDDLYILDPAELQGGDDHIEAKSIPTNLTASHSRVNGTEFYMSHAYNVGYWMDNPNVAPGDTTNLEIYVPVTKFIYSLNYQDGHHFFKNTNGSQEADFWKNHYLNPIETNDNTRYMELTNTVGVSLIEGFRKWAKFSLSAYASYQYRRYSQTTYELEPPEEEGDELVGEITELPANFNIAPRQAQSLLWVGGRLSKQKGATLRYAANARFGLVGDVIGDLELDGKIDTRFRLGRDTVEIAAEGFFHNTAAPYLLNHYISNHFAWDNDFGKTRTFHVGGMLYIPWSKSAIKAGVQNVQNLIYFNPDCLPQQYGGSVQVFSASLEQKLKFGIWNWNNTVTYQVSSNQDILPLPALTIYSNMFLDFTAFKVLHVQIGVDCDYYTSYKGYNYQPSTMTFHVQNPSDAVNIGNFPFCNLYATAKLSKVRFYVLWSHFNQNWFTRDYFALPHYPVNPRRLQFGLSVDFAN